MKFFLVLKSKNLFGKILVFSLSGVEGPTKSAESFDVTPVRGGDSRTLYSIVDGVDCVVIAPDGTGPVPWSDHNRVGELCLAGPTVCSG